MQVFCLSGLDELAPYADDWDRLSAGVPFRSWAWLSSWWRHYGPARSGGPDGPRLSVLCVFDLDDTLVGLAPWYLDGSGPAGRVMRLLGSGEVCSEYLSLLCQPGLEDRVARAVADNLTQLAVAEKRLGLRGVGLKLLVEAQLHDVNRFSIAYQNVVPGAFAPE